MGNRSSYFRQLRALLDYRELTLIRRTSYALRAGRPS